MTQALVPLKDLVQAKTRLAGLLSPSERRALTQAMLEDVLEMLAAHPEIAGITLVSDDPSAYLLAAQYNAVHWSESALGCRGLNAVIHSASTRLLAERGEPLVVLHADLPLLSSADITAVLAARRERGGLVVGSDRHGRGTNLLCFDAQSTPPFCFGAGSCARHLEAARRMDIPTSVLRRPGIGLDVDEPGDLAMLLEKLGGAAARHTATLLLGTDLGARIARALASLAPVSVLTDREEVR